MCLSLCTNVIYNTAQNSYNLPSYPPNSHHCSDVVYWRTEMPQNIWKKTIFHSADSKNLNSISKQIWEIIVDNGCTCIAFTHTTAIQYLTINSTTKHLHFSQFLSRDILSVLNLVFFVEFILVGVNMVVTPVHIAAWNLLLLLHPFNGLFSRTTWISLHQKV